MTTTGPIGFRVTGTQVLSRKRYWVGAVAGLFGVVGLLIGATPVTIDQRLDALPSTYQDSQKRTATVKIAAPGRYTIWAPPPADTPDSDACKIATSASTLLDTQAPSVTIKWVDPGSDDTTYTSMAEFKAAAADTYLIACSMNLDSPGLGFLVSTTPDVSNELQSRVNRWQPGFISLVALGLIIVVATAMLRRRVPNKSHH